MPVGKTGFPLLAYRLNALVQVLPEWLKRGHLCVLQLFIFLPDFLNLGIFISDEFLAIKIVHHFCLRAVQAVDPLVTISTFKVAYRRVGAFVSEWILGANTCQTVDVRCFAFRGAFQFTVGYALGRPA